MIPWGLLPWGIHLTGHPSHGHPSQGSFIRGTFIALGIDPRGGSWGIHPTGHSSHWAFIPRSIRPKEGSFCFIWGALIPLGIDTRWDLSHGTFIPRSILKGYLSQGGFIQGVSSKGDSVQGHWSQGCSCQGALIPLGIHPVGHGSSWALIPTGVSS